MSGCRPNPAPRRPDSPRARPDVLVVGLGPAGARAAEEAAKAGLSVVAVERKSRPGEPVQCAEFVPAPITQEVGGLERVTKQRIGHMVTFVEDGTPVSASGFAGRMIDRALFDAALAERAREAGADCRYGVAVLRLGARGEARLSDGSALRPRVLIGADGPRSAVGLAIGRVNRELVETRQIRVPLPSPYAATDVFLAAEFEGGYAWLFPRGEAANLGVGVRPSARRRLKPALLGLYAALAQGGRVGRRILGRTGGAIPVGGLLKAAGRLDGVPVVLAGDAAGLAHPITGAGIAPAVFSGALAGKAAAGWLAGDRGALDAYAEELDSVFGVSMARALARRRELLDRYERGERPGAQDLRRAWVAFPEYWTEREGGAAQRTRGGERGSVEEGIPRSAG